MSPVFQNVKFETSSNPQWSKSKSKLNLRETILFSKSGIVIELKTAWVTIGTAIGSKSNLVFVRKKCQWNGTLPQMCVFYHY